MIRFYLHLLIQASKNCTTLFRYFIIHKPFRVLTQFSPEKISGLQGTPKRTLKDLFKVPADVYPVGRLDYESEGLLILTNDASLNKRLLDPVHGHEREYFVQVEGDVTGEALNSLASGVSINVDGRVISTAPAIAIKLDPPPDVHHRTPPIRVRINIPDSWISLTLTEGKNRQVRRMTAAVGFPTLRLIRYRIGALTIEALAPGEMVEIKREQILSALFP